MKQVVDLQNDPNFQALDVAVVSIALDSVSELALGVQEYGITTIPLLSDPDSEVSAAYDVLKWAVASGEPSHTFILVDRDGTVVWIRDYGSPDKPDSTMYVPVDELTQEVSVHLK